MTMIIKGLSRDAFTSINETFGSARWYVTKLFNDYEDIENSSLDVTIDLNYVSVTNVGNESVSLYRAGWTATINRYDFVNIEII